MLSAGRGPRVTEGTFFPRGCSPAASPSYKTIGWVPGEKIHARLGQLVPGDGPYPPVHALSGVRHALRSQG